MYEYVQFNNVLLTFKDFIWFIDRFSAIMPLDSDFFYLFILRSGPFQHFGA